jgi:hypothetical protein
MANQNDWIGSDLANAVDDGSHEIKRSIELVSDSIEKAFVLDSMKGDGENLTDILKSGMSSIAYQLNGLGKGNSTDSRGAIEFLAISISEGCEKVASAIEQLAAAVSSK